MPLERTLCISEATGPRGCIQYCAHNLLASILQTPSQRLSRVRLQATMMFFRGIFPFLLLSAPLTQGQNTKEFGNDDYTVSVKVKSNQPRYYYWAKDDPQQSKYRVAFSKIYEKKGGNKVGGSNLALASIDWIIEQDTEAKDSVVFWINGTTKEKGNGNKADRFSVLSFRNEIVNDTVKFDVILDDYSWVDPTADSLDLEWKMTNSTGPESDTDEEPVRQRSLRSMLMGRSLADEAPVSDTDNQICWYGAGGDAENQVCESVLL